MADKKEFKKKFISWGFLVVGFVFIFSGLFLNWHEVYYNPTSAEKQDALKNGEKVPRMQILYMNEPKLIEASAFDEIEIGPDGELEKVPSLGFCES